VAAVHPDSSVWAWDWRPDRVEATRRLRDAAGLRNLQVHERPGLPDDLGGDVADVVVVQDVLAAADDATRARMFDAIRDVLRPGGLACVSYATTVGWIEIVPLVTLMRQSAVRYVGDPSGLVPHVLGLVAQLRDGGAKYVTERAVVADWVNDLFALDPVQIEAQFLRDRFRPISSAQVNDAMASIGCTFVGSARATDDVGLDLAGGLAEIVAAAPSRVMQETYRDLATRRAHRIDLFRVGGTAMSDTDRSRAVSELELAAVGGCEAQWAVELDDDVVARLATDTIRVRDLRADPTEAEVVARVLIDAGQLHPVVADVAPGAEAACSALNAAWAERGVTASPRLGTAIPAQDVA
jgi:hypothetical protein